MLIASSIEKDFGSAPGDPIYGPDIQRFLVLSIRDPLVISGGGGITTSAPSDIEEDSINAQAINLLGSGSELQLYLVTARIVDELGRVAKSFPEEPMWLPRGLASPSTISLPYDTVRGEYLGMTSSVQTNEPGWDGSALSIDELHPAQEIRYSFDPKPTVPFFTGIAPTPNLQVVTAIRPSQYIAAFEVFGNKTNIWYQNEKVKEDISWATGTRFHILYSPQIVRFFIGSTAEWSS